MTTATLTLTDFLLARLAEREEAARAATQGAWTWDEPEYGTRWELHVAGSGEGVLWASYDDSGVEGVDADKDHIAYWNPTRVLAECEAKRRIVELHRPISRGRYIDCSSCAEPYEGEPDPYPCDTLRLIALPYADHADYREEWRV